jgi:hypothetical protein
VIVEHVLIVTHVLILEYCTVLDHKHLRPKAIHDPEVLEAFSKDYMYFACIQFINSVGVIYSVFQLR